MNLSISVQTQMTVIAGAVIFLAAFIFFVVKAERKLKKSK